MYMEPYPLKLCVIGIDGLSLDLIFKLLPHEAFSAVRKLISGGMSGILHSVFPTHSAAAWASFITGQTPAGHGIFDFKVQNPDGHYSYAKPDPKTSLWYWLGNAGYRVGVFNFPITFPPDAVKGWMLSGMLSPDIHRISYPPSLARDMLEQFPEYILDVEWMLYQNKPEKLLEELTKMVTIRGAVAKYLLAKNPTDAFLMAFIGTDRAQHPLWKFIDPQHPLYNLQTAEKLRPQIIAFYQAIDQAVLHLIEFTDENTVIILLSDHGFQPSVWQFHLNDWLNQQGWLQYERTSNQISRWMRQIEPPKLQKLRRRLIPDTSRYFPSLTTTGNINWRNTLAFCPWNFHQGIRINVKQRDPFGIVSPGNEYDQLKEAIKDKLLTLHEPKSGLQVVSDVYFTEEIYNGPFLTLMPDIVINLQPGFSPGIHKQHLFEPTGWVSGDHGFNGFYALSGPGIKPLPNQPANIIDIVPTIYQLLGVDDHTPVDGKPLVANTSVHQIAKQDGFGDTETNEIDQVAKLNPEEEKVLLQKLRDLGYL